MFEQQYICGRLFSPLRTRQSEDFRSEPQLYQKVLLLLSIAPHLSLLKCIWKDCLITTIALHKYESSSMIRHRETKLVPLAAANFTIEAGNRESRLPKT